MNKLTLTFALTTCLGTTTIAQTTSSDLRIGIELNAGLSYLHGSESLADYASLWKSVDYDDDIAPNFGAGISFDFAATCNWGIQTGLHYQMKGTHFHGELDDDNVQTLTAISCKDIDIRLHYIQLPLLLRYRHQIGQRPLEWEAKAGPYISYAAGGRAYVDNKVWTFPQSNNKGNLASTTFEHRSYDAFNDDTMSAIFSDWLDSPVQYNSRRIDAGLVIGGGITFWTLAGNYYVGLSLEKGIVGAIETSSPLDNNHKLRNQNISLDIAFTF